MPSAETGLQHFQRASYHFLKRKPLFFEVEPARLYPRHIEQVIHQPRGVQHVLADLAGLQGVF